MTILYEDTQGTPQRGAVAINNLINVEHVPYALTAFTGVSKAIAPVAARAKVVLANGGGIGPDLATLGPYFWNVLPLVNEEVRALIPYIVKERGWKKITLVYLDEPIGEEVLKELRSGLDKEGGSVVAALAVPASAQQFGTVAAKVRDSNPDAVYIALARFTAGAADQAAARQRRAGAPAEQLRAGDAGRAESAGGQGRDLHQPKAGLVRRRSGDGAVRRRLSQEVSEGPEPLCRQLLQRGSGVRQARAALWKSRASPSPG